MRPVTKIIFVSLFALEGLFLFFPQAQAAEPDSIDGRKQHLLVPHEKFSNDCGTCHVPKTWTAMRKDFHFDHKMETGYELLEAHAALSCTQCHNDRGLIVAAARHRCTECHQDPHQGSLSMNCDQCHNQTDWQYQRTTFAEHARTRFPLTGMHAATLCEQCHTRSSVGDFKGAPVGCYSCHQADFNGAANHVSLNFPRQCDVCHNTSTFGSPRFTHNFLTAASDCFVCHQTDFAGAPQHSQFSFPRTCAICHTTKSWLGASFTHSFLGSNPTCFSCHQTDYARAPNHVSGSYPTTCLDCHSNTTDWHNTH